MANLLASRRRAGPALLDLIRATPRQVSPPGGEALYRHIALLAGLGGEQPSEILDVACGSGAQLAFLVREYSAHGSGVDADPTLVARSAALALELGVADRMQVQEAAPGSLPFRDGMFDLVVGELAFSADTDPDVAVAELMRVTRPGGTLVLVQLVWKAPLTASRQCVLADRLGTTPRAGVDWRRSLTRAGAQEVHGIDWSSDEAAMRPASGGGFPGAEDGFAIPDRLGLLRQAWRLWGWRGVQRALAPTAQPSDLLTHHRIVGLSLFKATRALEASGEVPAEALTGATVAETSTPENELPLFGLKGSGDPLPVGRTAPASAPSATAVAATAGAPAESQVEDLPLFESGGGTA